MNYGGCIAVILTFATVIHSVSSLQCYKSKSSLSLNETVNVVTCNYPDDVCSYARIVMGTFSYLNEEAIVRDCARKMCNDTCEKHKEMFKGHLGFTTDFGFDWHSCDVMCCQGDTCNWNATKAETSTTTVPDLQGNQTNSARHVVIDQLIIAVLLMVLYSF